MIRLAASLLATFLFLSSCSLVGLRKHVETMERHGTVAVQVKNAPETKPPTYSLAWREVEGKGADSVGFQQVRKDGIVAFSLRSGESYRIGAFTDENGNGAYDAGEPFAVRDDVTPNSLADPHAKPKLWELNLSRDHTFPKGTVMRVPKENKELGGKVSLSLGEVASLDEQRFAGDVGGGGMWRPFDFLSGNTMGIYFTEPYDPARIPVVLVYGIGGSPQDWRYFIQHLDRKRYQLWFCHYPSGMRLDRISSGLASGLRILKERHGFQECNVVAHSMGGLVSYQAINKAVAREGRNFIPRFVSISTPWGGEKSAESGLRHLKKPVPSWIDVTPESEFLRSIYATPLPQGTTHDLIYGSIEKRSVRKKEANDGVVTVASETDSRVAGRARSTKHFPWEHVEILNKSATVEQVERMLGR